MIPSFFKQSWWKKYTKFNLQLSICCWWELRKHASTVFSLFIYSFVVRFNLFSVWFFHVFSKISSRCETDMWYILSTRDAPLCECHFCHLKAFSDISWYDFGLKISYCWSSGYRIVIKIIFCLFFVENSFMKEQIFNFALFILFGGKLHFTLSPRVCSHCGLMGIQQWKNFEASFFYLAVQPSWTVINYVETCKPMLQF